MAKINFYLDPRPRKDGTSALLMYFIHKRFRRKINLGVTLEPIYWCEATEEVSNKFPKHRQVNQMIRLYRARAESVFLKHFGDDPDAATIFAELEAELFPEKVAKKAEQEAIEAEQKAQEEVRKNALPEVFGRFAAMKKESTRLTYERTLKHVELFCERGYSDNLDVINKAWLSAFDNYLSESNPSPNARALHMRNLRAVLNYALDEELTTNYPFRRFKIKTVKTAKRSLPVLTMHELLTCEVESWQEIYRDMFKLSFLLMGINFADMLQMTHKNLNQGRLEFNRHKTARLYSMKIEPEAMAIIRKYLGAEHLLNIMDSRTDYLQFIRQTNNALRKIGTCERHGLGGKKTITAICPELTTYWARHTWATIAASLDIPKETIAAALGHGGNSVTDIYIDFDRKKIDEANRMVIDWVLYGCVSDAQGKSNAQPLEVPKKKRGRPRKSESTPFPIAVAAAAKPKSIAI